MWPHGARTGPLGFPHGLFTIHKTVRAPYGPLSGRKIFVQNSEEQAGISPYGSRERDVTGA